MASFQPVQLAFKKYEPNSGVDENLAPIIYLHGLSASKEIFGDIPQIVANATKRRSYAVDARNHGDSDWNDQWDFDINADDLIHFMDSHNIRKAVLVGQSMGGVTATRVALKRPDLAEKIVVEDMVVRKIPKEIMKSVQEYITLVRKALELVPAELNEDEAKKFVAQYSFQNAPKGLVEMRGTKIDVDQYNHAFSLRRDANGRYSLKSNLALIEKLLSNPETAMSDPQGLYKGPALFIYGKLSPFLVGADEPHIKQFFPNAVFKGIEDAAHAVQFEKREEYIDALLKFI